MNDLEKLKQSVGPGCLKINPHLFKPLAGLGSPQPEYDVSRPLDKGPRKQRGSKGGAGRVSVLIVRYGRRKMDTDNLAFAHKALRDAISIELGIDDGDDRITFTYEQVIGKVTGTHILIQTNASA